MSEEPADRPFERQVVAQAPRADGAREAGAVGDVPGAEDADLARVLGEPAIAPDDEADVGVGGTGAPEVARGAAPPMFEEHGAPGRNPPRLPVRADSRPHAASITPQRRRA